MSIEEVLNLVNEGKEIYIADGKLVIEGEIHEK